MTDKLRVNVSNKCELIACWVTLCACLLSADWVLTITVRVSTSLDPDQAQHFVSSGFKLFAKVNQLL